ncbi:hypothetical protein BKA70DRAFT_119783 [Coprinopsis sp. MPI-PUGE-AT-0042]|nr:hypothetical protein BKA70DRAFT_119783 [Coprinopsis sp. MPI-PUGE-AT-0042]
MSAALARGVQAPALTVDRRPGRVSQRAPTQPEPNTPERPLPRRAYGSTSTTESDPFSELQPWASLFYSKIWSPDADMFSTPIPDSPADVEDRDHSLIDNEHSRRPSWVATVLDPTTLGLEFDHSCLQGLDHDLLFNPREGFAAVCWDHGTLDDDLLDSPQDAFADICWQKTTIAHSDISREAHVLRQDRGPNGYSPPTQSSSVPAKKPELVACRRPGDMAQVNVSEGSDDSDSDSIETFDDEDGYSNATITTLDCYGALGFTGNSDVYDLFSKNDNSGHIPETPQIVVFDAMPDPFYCPPRSNLNHDQSKSVRDFPTPTPHRRNLKVAGRIAAFCSTIPTKLISR